MDVLVNVKKLFLLFDVIQFAIPRLFISTAFLAPPLKQNSTILLALQLVYREESWYKELQNHK
jgi:hypothetical protein